MGRIAVIATLIALSACSHGEATAQHAVTARVSLACPHLQTSLGYAVRTLTGPDYLQCTMAPLRSGILPAQLYVGNYPFPLHQLQFIGFTPNPIGTLVWFSSAVGTTTQWVTYIPIGHQFPSVVMLSVESRTAPSMSQLEGVAGVVVGHSPNISFQRTRGARR